MAAQLFSFEELECWKAARELRQFVSRELMPLLKFCRNALGSGYEVLDHLIGAQDEGWITDEMLGLARMRIAATAKLPNGCVSHLKRAAETKN